MLKKLQGIGEAIVTGIGDVLVGIILVLLSFFNSLKALVANPRALIAVIVLAALGYDLVTGGKLGGIAFVAAKVREIFEITKDISWAQATAVLGTLGIGYMVLDKLKK